jgi:threonine synthase
MWRWFELMPVCDEANIVTLGEGGTPLLRASGIEAATGSRCVWVKEEGLNPTGSFKARGMSSAVSRAKELGVTRMAVPSAGNAASALAAYGARAGIETWIFMPKDTPEAMKHEAQVYGAHVTLVDGLINDAGRIVRENTEAMGWFDVSTLREPYRPRARSDGPRAGGAAAGCPGSSKAAAPRRGDVEPSTSWKRWAGSGRNGPR